MAIFLLERTILQLQRAQRPGRNQRLPHCGRRPGLSTQRQRLPLCLEFPNRRSDLVDDLAATLGAAKPTWGFSSSALVQGNLLVLDIGGCGAAVDKATGKVVWASDEEACGYSTPVPYTNHGAACAAILSAKGAYGVEAASGKLDWSFLFASSVAINIPDVVVSGNEFFVSTAASIGGAAFRVEGTNVAPVWTNSAFGNHVCTSVLVDGCLYGVAGAIVNGPGATLRCLDFATGAQKWEDASDPIGGFVVADHKFILLTNRGELVDGEVSPAGFTPISRAQVLAPSCWTSPPSPTAGFTAETTKATWSAWMSKNHDTSRRAAKEWVRRRQYCLRAALSDSACVVGPLGIMDSL